MAVLVNNLVPNQGAPITSSTHLSFDVVGEGYLYEGFVAVLAYFQSSGDYEVVYDGQSGGFAPRYGHLSTKSAISSPLAGFHFSLHRVGGWPENPTIRLIAFDILALA